MSTSQPPVAVVGAGPVGMTLALDLAWRGVEVTLIEQRAADAPGDAKCNTIAARTMEVFRRLGIADAVRRCGLGDDYPTDVSFRTAVTGPEMLRIPGPSRAERFAPDGRSAPGYLDSHWRTPEPVVRASQYFLDPLLREVVKRTPEIELLARTEFERFAQDPDGVSLTCRDLERDRRFDLRASYMVGADGGASRVRKQLGVALEGDAEISRTRTSLIRSRDLRRLFRGRPSWMTWVVSHRANGVVVAIDGEELWLVHRSLPRSAARFEDLDADRSLRDVLGVGPEFRYDVVHHQDWTGRRLVAARFRDSRVFLSGDAAHLWIPFAGYGMNAGIADAMNLSWMLAAVLQGWAPAALLEAHERERHPITEQVSRLAMGAALRAAGDGGSRRVPKLLSQRGPLGAILRRRLGRRLTPMNQAQFACEGLNFGYFYESSPIVHDDREPAPPYTMGEATPSTVPGCRLPHFWLDEKTSLYDRLGPWFTLLRLAPGVSVEPALAAAAARRIPLTLLDVPTQPEPDVFRHALVLVRPDQHVAWRGDAIPEDPGPWLDHVRGGAPDG